MALIPIKDIFISARQESHRMRHYYLGTEHLFIALLEIRSGLASTILSEYGLKAEYVIDAIRRKVGKGSRHRLWAGVPNTPRADVVIAIAQEIARESGRSSIHERDLLLAILEEEDNMPVRVLQALGLDLSELHHAAETTQSTRSSTQTFVGIDVAPSFDGELASQQLFILRRMFHGYGTIRVDSRLTGGYTSADLLVITPINVDTRQDASVVVKIGQTDAILDEAQRYERYVKGKLPPLTARLEDRPVAPDTSDFAALKYTLIKDADGNTKDLRAIIKQWSGAEIGSWLRNRLFKDFGEAWWQQKRPYRFDAWQEYDWLLPPILTLKLSEHEDTPPDAQTIRFPLRRDNVSRLEVGDDVVVENFSVYRVDRERNSITLAITDTGSMTHAYQIEVRGIDFEKDTYFRGEVVERLIGTVWQTRDEKLSLALRQLNPDFDVTANTINVGDKRLPNPLLVFQRMLDTTINGSLSTIHGDLHLGNILVGPTKNALLIDFARTRDGHTVFDWANLEVSLLSDLIVPLGDGSWESARELLNTLAILSKTDILKETPDDMDDAIKALQSLRQIVQDCLNDSDVWQEYYLALAMSCLRAMTWKTMSEGSRRLMFYMSAWGCYEFYNRREAGDWTGAPSPDQTDIATND